MMNNKICLILAWVFGVCAVVCGSEAGNPQKIRIYLPKDKTLESEVVELGKIALVLGDDDILPLVNELQLGKFSVHGQEIRIDPALEPDDYVQGQLGDVLEPVLLVSLN